MVEALVSGRKTFSPTNTFLVAKELGAPFNTITSALEEAELIASSASRVIVYVSPGQYDEDIRVPSFVSLIGISAGVQIAGTAVAGGFIVDVGQGISIENLTIVPKNEDKDVGLIIRDATLQEGDTITSPVNGTLHLNGKSSSPGDDEPEMVFVGESTTDTVVAVINALAVNVFAYNRYGKLAIISKLDRLTVYGTGTANGDLGYSGVDDTKIRSSEASVYISGVSIIGDGGYSGLSGGQTYDVGLETEDRGYGSVIINGLSITGSNNGPTGVGAIVRRGAVLGNNLIITGMVNGGLGVWLEKDDETTPGNLLLGTVILIGNTTDFDGETGTTVMAMLVNNTVVAGSSGFTYIPTANIAAMAKVEGWPYSSPGVDGVIEGLTDSSRKPFISAKEMYSPTSGGATDAELGTIPCLTKKFITAVDKKVTFSEKHVESSNTEALSGNAKLRLICSISVSGIANDVVRIEAQGLSIADGESLVSASAQTLTSDVDVSAWVADDRHDVNFEFSAAGAKASPDEFTELMVSRLGAHVNDTYGGSLHIWGFSWMW